MQILLNVENENLLTKLKDFISTFNNGIEILDENFANIDLIEDKNDKDFKLIEEAKREKNSSYSIEEVRKLINGN